MNLKNLPQAAAVVLVVIGIAACGGRSEPAGGLGGGSGGGTAKACGQTVTLGSASTNADFHTLRTVPLAAGQIELLTLSTLPDTVSNGDVLAAVRGLEAGDRLCVSRNGSEVSSAFSRQDDGDWRGLVDGLVKGDNQLVAVATGPRGTRAVQLRVKNHPVSGPILSGPHQTPFVCRTAEAGLGEPVDANCLAPTRFQWFYKSLLRNSFVELADPYAAYPSEVASTLTAAGESVPFVVRVESAIINRGIARIAVLDDPAARGPDAPFVASRFSGSVYYIYGESCGPGYHQGNNDPTFVLGGFPDLATVSGDRLLINLVGGDQRLSRGDVVVHSTLSAFGVHCNPLVSIETATMIKEHISEQYGLVGAVIGTNGSGAALQQYNAANNAPGLLSIAMPTATFADILSTAMTVTDCGLLTNYYNTSSLDWTQAKRAAVNGHLNLPYAAGICQSWTDAFLSVLDPAEGCSGAVPRELRYNAESNPQGLRCSLQDANVNYFGRDPATGFARRPVDNTGVQYGLAALNAGDIGWDEFLDLNRQIGGYDLDAKPVPQRMRMDSEVAAISYRLGGIIGHGALAETPVMDFAPYLDLIPVANIHEAIRPFTVRARLRQYSGQDATQSIWRGVLTQPDGFAVMEDWLSTLQANRPEPGGDHMAAVIAAKPAGAADRCKFGTVGGRLDLSAGLFGPLGIQVPLPVAGPEVVIPLAVDIPEDFDSGLGPCSVVLPVTSTPRMVAGMPLSDDVIRCQLKAIGASDYASAPSEAQLTALREIFPDGVCDYSKPAAEAVEKSLIWPSLGGETLEPARELKWRVGRS